MGMEQLSLVASTTMHDFISNATRNNADLQKTQRKGDKDKSKKSTGAGKTGSKGVGIGASSIGNQDLTNMGDMRGRNSDLFSSEDEDEDEDAKELKKELDFFNKDNIFKIKMGLAVTEEKVEELEEEDYEEDSDDLNDDSSEGRREGESQDDGDEVLDGIKDKRDKDKITLTGEEKDIKDGDPEHKLKDRFSSDEEEDYEEEEEDDEDIYLPQIRIKPTGILMEDESSTADKFESSSESEEAFLDSPSLYEVDEEEDEGEVDEVKSSAEYIKEKNNRNRIKKMIVHYPTTKVAKNLVDQMYIIGEKILETCLEFGVKIVILKKSEQLSDIIGNSNDVGPLRAGYSEKLKVCFIGEEWVSPEYQDLYRFNSAIYLMALAFDHATGGDSYASLKSPFVLNNYHACKREEEGHQFIDGLTSFSPVEYFAQSVEAYFQKSEPPITMDMALRIFEGKICTQNELYYTDLSMYQYIDYLANS